MSRYLPHVRSALSEGKLPHIERLPNGTSRTDGHTFDEAKALLVEEMREARDYWTLAATMARKLTRDQLSLADVQGETEVIEEDEPENQDEDES